MTQTNMLADMYEKARALNLYYISKLKEVDPYLETEIGGVKLNSIYWITAHLIWAENNLVVSMTGGESLAPNWSSHYHLGADGSLHEGHGSFKELLHDFKETHAKCMEYLRTLSDETLAEENTLQFQFGDGDCSKRLSIQHAIRHESTHTGHYGWIAKIKAVKTV